MQESVIRIGSVVDKLIARCDEIAACAQDHDKKVCNLFAPREARKSAELMLDFVATLASVSSMAAVVAAIMAIFAPNLVSVFAADDPDILSIGTLMIRTQCYTMLFHIWVMLITSLFQALGRALASAVLSLSRQVLCLIPAVIILSKLFGVTGLAVSQASADVLGMVIAVPLLVRFMKQLNKLIDESPETPEEAQSVPDTAKG